MRIALFGASGKTGKHIVEQALAGGHEVTALARNPGKLAMTHPKLKVLEGDVRDFGAVERTINQSDAVLSALGRRGARPGFVVSDGVRHMIMAMERSGVNRIITVGSAGILGEAGLYGVFLKLLLKGSLADHVKELALLQESGLEWTVVRPRVLTNGARKGVYRVTREGLPKRGLFISRADVAHFMLKCMTGKKYGRCSPAIAY
jgi:putative NADH-flavin reductase